MGLIEQLSQALEPHSKRLNDTLHLQGALLHQRLAGIERNVSDLGRPDVGDKWYRIVIKGKLQPGRLELGEVPMNEEWMLQSIVTDGITQKTPNFIVEANNALIFASPAEFNDSRNFGGNVAFLPGEVIYITPRIEGLFYVTINLTRRRMPIASKETQLGYGADKTQAINTHDPARDVIRQRLAHVYQEIPGVPPQATSDEILIVDPTSVG